MFLKKPESVPNCRAIFWGSVLWNKARKVILEAEHSLIIFFFGHQTEHIFYSRAAFQCFLILSLTVKACQFSLDSRTKWFSRIPGIGKIPRNSRDFPGNLGKFCILLVRPKIPENSREFLGTPPAVFNSFSRILENSREFSGFDWNVRKSNFKLVQKNRFSGIPENSQEWLDLQILSMFKRTGSHEFPRIPRNDLTYRF